MSYRYVGVLMTNRLDSNGNMFSEEALKKIFEEQPQVPVTINFSKNPIGKTTNFYEREDKAVLCEFDIQFPDMDRLDVFVVPGCKVNLNDIHKSEDGKTTILNNIDLIEVSITTTPSDQSLTTIRRKE